MFQGFDKTRSKLLIKIIKVKLFKQKSCLNSVDYDLGFMCSPYECLFSGIFIELIQTRNVQPEFFLVNARDQCLQ
ncbi:hypothetical protein DDZ16_20380 [Marinilabilia rubra]|uniref:Uncharacterized protein n=1 Tax=Marinilabilia rubra TaxID=2162893 RepID=A0A2U2B382_9BACT|nr:hypothetical protein DDZ16_20380 [Marinilabilia rubra]